MSNQYTIYRAKRVVTMDAMQPEAEAIVICGNKIAEVGSYDDLIDGLKQKGVAYKVNTDYENHYIFPGFIESHCHATVAGAFFNLPYVGQFSRSDTINKGMSFPTNASVLSYLKTFADSNLEKEKIIGWGYDSVLMEENTCLTRADLDTVSTEKPVVVFNASCHAAVFNTRALEICGLMEDRENPHIIKDDAGIPNGQIVELTAFKYAFHMLDLDFNKLRSGLYQVANTALKNGFTTVNDMAVGSLEGDLVALTKVTNELSFPVRITCYVVDSYVKSDLGDVAGLKKLTADNNEKFRIAGAKFFTDGSIQVHTACMHYHDSEETGVANTSAEELEARYSAYVKAGIQCATHCNGTDAIQISIDKVKAVAHQYNVDRIFRMEHCQTVNEYQLEDIEKYGITPTFLINHLCFWSDFHAQHSLGQNGVQHLDPCHSAKRNHIRFSLHSDCPVSTLNPFILIYGATERKNRLSGKVYGDSEKISVYDAVKAITIDAAYIQNEDHIKGSLTSGKLADFTVLDKNILDAVGEDIVNTQVLATCCDGQLHTFSTH